MIPAQFEYVAPKTLEDALHLIERHGDEDLLVHRKGATRAFGPSHPETPVAYRGTGQPVLIPGSMGTASYVLVGTDEGFGLSFGSTCHGAGHPSAACARSCARSAGSRNRSGRSSAVYGPITLPLSNYDAGTLASPPCRDAPGRPRC